MHMIFVDESGDPGYPPNGQWSAWGGSTHFVRAGVIIHGWRWKAWHQRLLRFKQDSGLRWDAEIKASDIRRGAGAFIGWDEARRKQFLLDLSQEIGGQPDLTLLGVVVDKRKVDPSKGDRLVRPQVRSLELLLERYNGFLHGQQDKSGIVILDPTAEHSDDDIRYFQSFLIEKSRHLRPLHIVEGTFFAKSHTSNMMQIADVCTNILYRESTRPGQAEFKLLHSRFWRQSGHIKGYGLKEWP